MKKRFIYFNFLAILTMSMLTGCNRYTTEWQCSATDAAQMYWVKAAPTKVEATTNVLERCQAGSTYRSTCFVSCIPPTVRWHCIAVDKAGHTWYRNSVKRTVAIRNARRDCRQNTTVGGCRVPSRNCSMT